MDYYSKIIQVDGHDVDFNGVARTSALMRYIQTAAQDQLTDNGMSYDQLKERGRAFILSRIKMEICDTVREYEPLTALTFPCESRGYSFLRCYKLMRGAQTIGRAVSVWAMIDTDTRALVKVNDFDLKLRTFEPLDMALTRIAMPTEMREVGKYTVSYGMLDRNRHMNNTRYPDIYSTFLPMDGMRIAQITINYLGEAPEGDTLSVYRGEADGYYYFRTVRSDGKVNSEAEIRLERI